MLIINHQTIDSLNISPNVWLEWADTVLRNKHLCIMPPKGAIHFGESYFNTMPSVIPFLNVMGVKVVDRFLSRIPAVVSRMMLFDYSNGEMLALMDATKITAMRTAAAAVHAISMYANSRAQVMGFMGYGNIGTAFLDVFATHFKDRQFTVKFLRHKDHFDRAKERYARFENLNILPVDSAADIIRDSDVIVSAITFAGLPLGEDSLFKEGCLVVPIHLRGFENCDLFFDKVYGDDLGQVSGFKYFAKFKFFAENSEVLRGEKCGRENDKERIIVYNVGMSLHDVYAGTRIYEVIKGSNLALPEIFDLSPNKKTWISDLGRTEGTR